MSSITLSIEAAPKFIAQLVREGVVFRAVEGDQVVVIEFTGGF